MYTDYSMNTDLCFDMQIISILFFTSNIKELMLRYVLHRHGLAPSGTEYGPLTDLPDWSYAGNYDVL